MMWPFDLIGAPDRSRTCASRLQMEFDRCVSLAEVYPETPEVRFGHDRASASVRFYPNYYALVDAMFEVMDELGGG